MTSPNIPVLRELKPRIAVIGVGGAGCNAINNMIDVGLEGVEFIVANTDAQQIMNALTERRIQLGATVTQGLGAGARPDVGRQSAEESQDQISEQLQGCHMVFITAGMGGGTGTGAAPVIAQTARDLGILTVGVVTKPFRFEGVTRMRIAEEGITELTSYVDTLVVIPNQNLFHLVTEGTTIQEAFRMADNVLYSAVRGITDLMVEKGMINLDFADVKTVMSQKGRAMMGSGEAEGDGRATRAAEAAVKNPLIDGISLSGARGVLINITGGPELSLFEVEAAADAIRQEVDPEADIIFGAIITPGMTGKIRVSLVATGIDTTQPQQQPGDDRRVSPGVAPLRLVERGAGPTLPPSPDIPPPPAAVPLRPAMPPPLETGGDSRERGTIWSDRDEREPAVSPFPAGRGHDSRRMRSVASGDDHAPPPPIPHRMSGREQSAGQLAGPPPEPAAEQPQRGGFFGRWLNGRGPAAPPPPAGFPDYSDPPQEQTRRSRHFDPPAEREEAGRPRMLRQQAGGSRRDEYVDDSQDEYGVPEFLRWRPDHDR